MPAKLYCKTGELAGASYTIDREATIGRASENTIVLHPSIVSSQHAHIVFDDKEQCYFIHDLGSRNGTSVDGVEVTGPVRLGMLHVITFADELNFFFQHMPAGTASATPAAQSASSSAAASPASNQDAPQRERPRQTPAKQEPARQESQQSEDTGAHTVFGLNFGNLPSLDDEASASAEKSDDSVATEYGFKMDQLPAELSGPAEEDDEPERVTQRSPDMAQLPDLDEAEAAATSDEDDDEDDEDDEAPRTHFWEDFGALPSLDPTGVDVSRQPSAGRAPTEETPRSKAEATKDSEDTSPEQDSFQTPLPAALSEPAPTDDEAAVDVEEANTVFSWGSFALEIHKGDVEQRWFDLKPGETTVGRRRDNDIAIPHHSISRLHAIFVVRGDTVSIMDCGSKNHTLVNGQRLDPQVEHQLKPGTTVRFGPQFEATVHYK